MKIQIRTPKKSDLQVGIAYLVLGTLGLGLTWFVPNLFRLIPPCLFKSFTGIPCPSCGATHAGVYLGHLQITSAFLENPFFFILYIILAMWGLNTLLAIVIKKNFALVMSSKERKVLRIIFLSALPINWLYLIIASLK